MVEVHYQWHMYPMDTYTSSIFMGYPSRIFHKYVHTNKPLISAVFSQTHTKKLTYTKHSINIFRNGG